MSTYQRNFFNWTMTTRRESDVYDGYGLFTSLTNPTLTQAKILGRLSSKERGIAWIVSNCDAPSKRQVYADQLSTFIPVENFGNCSGRDCDYGGNCDKMIKKDFKFYLAFENTVCRDYVTEKFYNRLAQWAVPIVLSRATHSFNIPQDSFIAADDFHSASDLADHLRSLINDPLLLLKYHQWRLSWRVTWTTFMCNLCTTLVQGPIKVCSYRSFNQSHQISYL